MPVSPPCQAMLSMFEHQYGKCCLSLACLAGPGSQGCPPRHHFRPPLTLAARAAGDIELQPLYKDSLAATALGLAYTIVQGMIIINLILGVVISSLDKARARCWFQHVGAALLLALAARAHLAAAAHCRCKTTRGRRCCSPRRAS